MSGEALLRLEGLSVPGCPALDALAIEVRRGDAVALVGPTGSGKTRLMRIAVGLDASAGTVTRAHCRIAFVFDEGGLVSNLSVFDNLMVPLSYGGVKLRDAIRRSEEAIDAFGLGPYRGARPATLSRDLRQLTQFARAQALDAELLFLDEALLRMSPSAVVGLVDWLRWRVDEGRAGALMASVQPDVIGTVATRVVELPEVLRDPS